MKKFTFLMCAVFACLLQVNAQQFVSTDPQNRNAVIEEFTGRMCGYCPYGQALVNQVLAQYPGQVYTVNLHAESSLSPTSSPNLNTTKGAEVLLAFNNGGGIPAVVVNRGETMHPVEVSKVVPSMLEEVAECNIGGQVLINKETRTATVTVEVYYTANSASATNYLTVMMVQDSIFGYQSDYGPQLYGTPFNPEQMIDGQYVHMHTLRDYVTATWGDEITTTTAGSLVTKTYTYEIPEVIGDPNGVEVDLSDIHFMAFVSEKKQGTKTVPILNVAGLESLFVTNAEHYPYFNAITVGGNVSCTTVKPVTFEFVNGGTQDITSLKYEVTIWNNKTQYTWEGNLPSYTTMQVEEELNVPVGNLDAHFRIFEVNGQSHNYTEKVKLVNDGWIDAYFPGDEDEFKIDILQDKYGDHITWELLNSNEEVIASGGPYATLVANGGRTISLKVTELPDHFKTSILGYKVLENGNYVEVANVKPVTFALGCEIQGDVKARRIWFYLCNVAPISESSKTKADSIEANGITLNITVRPLQISNDYAITNISARPGDSNYASFFSRAPEIPSL